ncbi:MAG: hypothetical protein IPL46_03740 [Saprospiraceae bacterium]|nr:hypothetical protein [Saprospiraceae bacterium]
MRLSCLIMFFCFGECVLTAQQMTVESNSSGSAVTAVNEYGWGAYGEGYNGISAKGNGGEGVFCDGIVGTVFGANAYSGYFIGGRGFYVSPRLGINNSDPMHPIHVGKLGISAGNGAHVTIGGAWTNGSSKSIKHTFRAVNSALVLQKLSSLDLTLWNYKKSDEGQHLGPVAEEFGQTFGLGENDAYISTIDADGVALAALKELIIKIENQNQTIQELFERLDRLQDSDGN